MGRVVVKGRQAEANAHVPLPTRDGVAPSYGTISDGSYPGARPLFIYVKKAHIKPVPGMTDFLAAFARSWDPGGPLTRRGMIAAPADIRAKSTAEIASQTPLDPAGLH